MSNSVDQYSLTSGLVCPDCSTVKPVLSGHWIIDKTNVLRENGSLMKVGGIAECSKGNILQYFWPELSDNWYWCSFLVAAYDRFYCMLLRDIQKIYKWRWCDDCDGKSTLCDDLVTFGLWTGTKCSLFIIENPMKKRKRTAPMISEWPLMLIVLYVCCAISCRKCPLLHLAHTINSRGSGWGVWYSLFIKNLAHYLSHKNFGLFIKIRPIIH